jgi:hypothetical protein
MTFPVNPSTLVFTTRFIISDNEPILNVFHHEVDGAWEFTGATQAIGDSDHKPLLLSEILNIDPSVSQVAGLPPGYRAFRPSPGEAWQISQIRVTG